MQFVAEVQKIAQSFQKAIINILVWHTQVYLDLTIDVKSGSVIHREVSNGMPTNKITKTQGTALSTLQGLKYVAGGTTLGSVKAYLNARDKGKAVSGLVIFTDGHVESAPPLPKADKIIAILVGNGASDQILKAAGVTTYMVDIKS